MAQWIDVVLCSDGFSLLSEEILSDIRDVCAERTQTLAWRPFVFSKLILQKIE